MQRKFVVVVCVIVFSSTLPFIACNFIRFLSCVVLDSSISCRELVCKDSKVSDAFG